MCIFIFVMKHFAFDVKIHKYTLYAFAILQFCNFIKFKISIFISKYLIVLYIG